MPGAMKSPDLKTVGAALGLSAGPSETSAEFAARCAEAARRLKAAAGITWADYVLARAEGGTATFGLRAPGGLSDPRWAVGVGDGLDELAGKLGMYEDTT